MYDEILDQESTEIVLEDPSGSEGSDISNQELLEAIQAMTASEEGETVAVVETTSDVSPAFQKPFEEYTVTEALLLVIVLLLLLSFFCGLVSKFIGRYL